MGEQPYRHRGRNIAKSAVLATCMMVLFKILGFIKQAVIAYYFGADAMMDAYFIAFGFVSGASEAIVKALSISLVTIYSSAKIIKGRNIADELVSSILELAFPICLIICGMLCIFAPLIAQLIAPSFDSTAVAIVKQFIWILSPMFIIAMFEIVIGAVLDSEKEFFVPRLQSLFYSISVIIASAVFHKLFGIYALPIGQYISSLTFSIVLITELRKKCNMHFVKPCISSEIKSICRTALPLFVGNSILYFNNVVDKAIATGLSEGTTSALSYCHTIEQLVTNIIIVNIGNILFSHFADEVVLNNTEKISNTLYNAINILVTALIPVAIITIFCSEDIVKTVFYRGQFSYEAVQLTACALVGYAIAFPIVAFRDLTVKSSYAFGDTRHPMIASTISVGCNIVLSIVFSKIIGILGISVATSISALLGLLLNALWFKKKVPTYKYKKHLFDFLRLLIPVIGIAASCGLLCNRIQDASLLRFIIVTVVGFCVYSLLCIWCRVDAIRQIISITGNVIQIKRGVR